LAILFAIFFDGISDQPLGTLGMMMVLVITLQRTRR